MLAWSGLYFFYIIDLYMFFERCLLISNLVGFGVVVGAHTKCVRFCGPTGPLKVCARPACVLLAVMHGCRSREHASRVGTGGGV